MPLYEFCCDKDIGGCGHEFEEFQKLRDEPLKKCPVCKKNKLYKKFSCSAIKVTGNPKTVGALAEENSRKMSSEERARRLAEYKTKKVEGTEVLRNARGQEIKAIPHSKKEGFTDKDLRKKLKKANLDNYVKTGQL